MKVVTHAERLEAAGATAVFVAHDEPALLRRLMLSDVDCPYPVVVDTERTAYRSWGLRRASFSTVWLDPGVWRQYAGLLRAGARLRGMGSDVRQLGGDFLVDRDGRVLYSRPQRRDDRPPVGRLLRKLEEMEPSPE